MINCIESTSDQRIILEILQLLSEFEHVVKLYNEINGEESPVELLRGLLEQPETIQVAFLRWVSQRCRSSPSSDLSPLMLQFSSMAATSNGRTMLIDIQDSLAPLFTDFILNESASKQVKYEIIVILHNLLCINTDVRVSTMLATVHSSSFVFCSSVS